MILFFFENAPQKWARIRPGDRRWGERAFLAFDAAELLAKATQLALVRKILTKETNNHDFIEQNGFSPLL